MYTKKIHQRQLRKLNHTRKMPMVEKLNKTRRGRIYNMETYKINCGKNMLVGLKSIKAAEETSLDAGNQGSPATPPFNIIFYKDDFLHVVVSELKDYNEPVIVKVYDKNNAHLPKEMKILKTLTNYRNVAKLICEFSCADDKNRYLRKIYKKIKFCSNGIDKLHFFVYEFIGGDINEFLTKNNDENVIKSLVLQTTCVIIELGSIYNIQHGDINSGNILVDETEEETMEYVIDGENISIKTHGIMPKIIDFGRSRVYVSLIPIEHIWYDIVFVVELIYKYTKNETLKDKLDSILLNGNLELNSLTEYYNFVANAIQ